VGVVFPGVDGPRHPVALYDGAKNLLLVPILILVLRRWPAGRGVATGAFLLLYAGLRFLVDLFRDYEGGWLGIGQGQYFNLGMAAIGLVVLVWALRRKAPALPAAAAAPRRVSPLAVGAFILLCLYPLGIPTSWTRQNIETIRAGTGGAAGPAPMTRRRQRPSYAISFSRTCWETSKFE
jgi:phosphatidylglycerol:prolipoprotein diacylglycerol transferase